MHLLGILFPHINDDARSKSLQSLSILVRMSNISAKFVDEINIHTLCSINFYSSKNRAFYVIVWRNTVEWGRLELHALCVLDN